MTLAIERWRFDETVLRSSRPYIYCSVLLWFASCSAEVSVPDPSIVSPAPNSQERSVSPVIICNDQFPTTVTVNGDHFSPIPIDIPNDPRVALPSITINKASELDGTQALDSVQVFFSGNPSEDQTNYLADGGETPRLSWTSQSEMSLVIDQALDINGNASAMLAEGIYDINITNPDKSAALSSNVLAVAPKPTLNSVSPEIVCLEEGERSIVINGHGLLRIEERNVALQVEGAQDVLTTLEACSAIQHAGIDAESCESARAILGAQSIDAGYPSLSLLNPETAACHSAEIVRLRVVPKPTVDEVVPVLGCVAEQSRSFEIRGSGFLSIDGIIPLVSIGGKGVNVDSLENCTPLETTNRIVESCSSIIVTVAQGALDPGLYDLEVANPEPAGCSASAHGIVRITPPPTVTATEPVLACIEQGEREIVVHGSDFLEIDGVGPKIQIGDQTIEADNVVAEDCSDLDTAGLAVKSCSELSLRLTQELLDAGLFDLTVTNPEPAGCSALAEQALRIVAPPTVIEVEPLLTCLEQSDRTINIRGSDFLVVDDEMPQVAVGSATIEPERIEARDCETVETANRKIENCSQLLVAIEEDSLSGGLFDVTVANPDPAGCSDTGDDLFQVVESPVISSVTPSNVCASAGDTEITIEGEGFLIIDEVEFELRIGDSVITPNNISGCTTLDSSDIKVESCTIITATVSPDSLSLGDMNVVITNPAPGDCAVTATGQFRIVSPPEVTGISNTPICSNVLSQITITGADFAVGATVLAGDIEADSVQVDSPASLTATFDEGLPTGNYAITVQNGEGCVDSLAAALDVDPSPIVFFVDPPVIYSGVTIEATIFTTDLTATASSVELTDESGEATVLSFSSPDRANRIQATIPDGEFADGNYQVEVTSDVGCVGTLPGGLSVTSSLDLGDLSIDPAYASPTKPTAVTIEVDTNTGVGFESIPRVYLNPSTPDAVATAVRAVVMVDETTLTGVIPENLSPGSYDLIVVNPTGEVGLIENGLTVTVKEPPLITSVLPESLVHNEVVPVTIRGENFDTEGDISVRLLCNGSVSSVEATDENTADGQTVEATFNIADSGLESGDICQVELTNSDGSGFAYSAISIRNNEENLNPWTVTTDLVEARRAPSVVAARPTATSRYLYAIGGDSGVTDDARAIGTVKNTIEAANIDVYGEMGSWSVQRNPLPQPRTWAGVARVDDFVYLVGGHDGTAATNTLYRAEVLDPMVGPVIADLDAELGDGSSGLSGGLWIYRIAASYPQNDAKNPNGESIPGEVLNVQLPDRNEKIRLKLLWTEVEGANGYRVYRSPEANDSVEALELVAEIECGATTPCDCSSDPNQCQYWDDGSATDPSQSPLPPGSLGVWHAVTSSSLNTPREAHATVAAPNFASSGQWFLYAFGGRKQNGDYLNSYEYATVTVAEDGSQTVSAWTLVTTAGERLSSTRAELGAFLVTQADGEIVGPTEAWIYIGSGRTTDGALSRNLDASLVGPSGSLGTITTLDTGDWPHDYPAGYGYGAANNKLFIFGGRDGEASTGGMSAKLCNTADCLPDLEQQGIWGALGPGNNTRLQIYSGSAQESAFFFLVGGHDGTNTLQTTEQTAQ